MYCTHCGAKIEDENKFCPNCGNKIEEIVDENLIDKYTSSSHDFKFKTSFKNFYYCSKLTFWSLIIVIVLFSAFIYPFYLSTHDNGDEYLFYIFASCTGLLFLLFVLTYLIAPLITIKRAKKHNFNQTCKVYKDRYVIENQVTMNSKIMENATGTTKVVVTYYFAKIIKAYQDNDAFYFVFKQKKKQCLAITKNDMPQTVHDYFQSIYIAHRGS